MTKVGVIATLAAAALALVLAAPVSARPGLDGVEETAAAAVTGSGSGTINVRDVTTVAALGGLVVQKRTLEGRLTGSLDGTFVEHVLGIIRPNGSVTFFGDLVFTGTVAGCGEGTVKALVFGQAVSGVPTAHGTMRVIPVGSTLPINGTGTFEQVGTQITYEVEYGCA